MHQCHRRVGRPGATVATNVAGDDPQEGAAVAGRQQDDVVGLEPLISGRDHLVPGREVHPELDAVEEAA